MQTRRKETWACLESKPRPAMLVAVVALVAALGGSAVAEVATTSKLNKNDKKQIGKIAKKKAKSGDKKQDKRNFPVTGAQIADGAVTPSKITGVPKAWANVSDLGVVKEGQGITSADIEKGSGSGRYCFNGVGGASAQATAGYWIAGESGARAIDAASVAEVGGLEAFGCPEGSTWVVTTHSAASGGGADIPFNVVFFE